MNTFEAVKKIIAGNLDCDEADITMQADLKEDLGADSLDAVELIMALEDEFEISIPAETAQTLKTVGEIVALVDTLKKG